MSKSILEEIEQITGGIFGSDFRENYASVMRRNYYALEASSIKESFDSDVFSLYDDQQYKSVERPRSHFTFNTLSVDRASDWSSREGSSDNEIDDVDENNSLNPSDDLNFDSLLCSIKAHSTDPDESYDSVIQYTKSKSAKKPVDQQSIEYNRRLSRYFEHRNSIEELKQVRAKVRDVENLDFDVNTLIFKAVEVHTDILVSRNFPFYLNYLSFSFHAIEQGFKRFWFDWLFCIDSKIILTSNQFKSFKNFKENS